MRSRTVTGVVLLASGLMGIGMGTAHADADVPHDAASWGSTFQAGASSASTSTYDDEVHSGAASKFSQEPTHYADQAATNPPAYDPYGPGYSGQSQTVGGSPNNFSNSVTSGSSVVGGFVTQGVTGSQYTNDQISTGGPSSAQSFPGSVW
ncbi:hypothetical protein ACFYUJ_28605 [Streptomyces sp. NPDC004520]|uniref:hypothetical protein n=1 Tax=Streptomyces sp. NPDC004520 TaxID=3364702 RepID=UPI0036AB7D9F